MFPTAKLEKQLSVNQDHIINVYECFDGSSYSFEKMFYLVTSREQFLGIKNNSIKKEFFSVMLLRYKIITCLLNVKNKFLKSIIKSTNKGIITKYINNLCISYEKWETKRNENCKLVNKLFITTELRLFYCSTQFQTLAMALKSYRCYDTCAHTYLLR